MQWPEMHAVANVMPSGVTRRHPRTQGQGAHRGEHDTRKRRPMSKRRQANRRGPEVQPVLFFRKGTPRAPSRAEASVPPSNSARTSSQVNLPNDSARAEARRKAAALVFSLVCDVIAHDPPNGDPVDAELRSLAEEFRRRGGLPEPIRRDMQRPDLSTRVDRKTAFPIKPPWED